MADVKKMIKDLAKAYGDSNEDQGKMVQILKGLAFSDDADANTFMKALDKWTTQQANKMYKDESVITLTEDVTLDMGNREVILEAGDRIRVISPTKENTDKKVKILAVAHPSKRNVSLNKYVGRVLPFGGNAWDGFYVILDNGSEVDAGHFFYDYVK